METDFEDLTEEYLVKEYKRLNQMANEARANANAIMEELNGRYLRKVREARDAEEDT